MGELLTPIIELIQPVIDTFIEHWALIALAFLTFWLLGWYGWSALLNRAERWRNYDGRRRFLQPATWFKIQPKSHHKIKEDILANENIRGVYAPASRFTRDLREREQGWKLAWLSPYPKAVKASVKDAPKAKGKKLDARKQIRQAARSIEIAHLPEDRAVANGLRKKDAPEGGETEKQKRRRLRRQALINEANHFRINLATMGKDPAVIERIENNLRTQLSLKGGLVKLDIDDPTILGYLAYKVAPVDPLTEGITAEYLDEHRATIVYKLVLGIDQAGRPLVYEVHHTLILGTSGSGKGSPIQATIYQLAPFVKQGLAQIYAVDPKRAEFALYNRFPSSLIKRVTLGSKDDDMRAHADTISELLDIIDQRTLNAELSITEGEVEDGRDYAITKNNPLIMLIIDEFPSLFQGFKKLGKDGAKPLAELEQVISMGRFVGVYVMLATQRSEKDIIDAVAPNITRYFLLRQPSPYFNQKFLGDDAAANGFDSTRIPASSAPSYETAGMGFTLDKLGRPFKYRFAYMSKDDMARMIREFRAIDEGELEEFKREDEERRRAAGEFDEIEEDDGGFGFSANDEEEVPELEVLSIDDFDEPLPGMT
ncbi:FtsK/SpoIIIE domain-containing protein [Microbacterium sp. Leaf436]|uniref:FtsK/SpoIIIE domain-containing protein n=1 Tax=Microbacterium sp. Leaf436 TaxID=1736377 RepID=UPI0006F1DFE2|nr:FtsK/SpoIIIE domain-containing protein [Microbacterium sp. Leaf436]KQT72009.1 hypothetical protein ASG45_13605 [Microbacterium sp. Leaf436]